MRVAGVFLAFSHSFVKLRVGRAFSTRAPQTFRGEIMDTICGEYKGHARMMRETKSMGTDKNSCIRKCLELRGKHARYNAMNGTVNTIANLEKARALGGPEVEVTETLDKKKLTITWIKRFDTGARPSQVLANH